jgi:hypothetical protein
MLYQANTKATVYNGVKEKEVEVVVKTEKLNNCSIETWLTCPQLFISSIHDPSQERKNNHEKMPIMRRQGTENWEIVAPPLAT